MLALAILIIIHEFGHFLFARMFGVRVEKFYIFFDPWTEIFKWKPGKYFGFFGKTRKMKGAAGEETPGNEDAPGNEEAHEGRKKKSFWKDTEYGIGWIPLGGYCKISGMIDESMDTEQMKQPPREWEFRCKPAWQRLLIMIAGVLFNFLLAILIYAGIVYATGEKYVTFPEAKMGMTFSGEAQKAGFRNGDIILRANGKEVLVPGESMMEIAQAKRVDVLRGGDTVSIAIPSDFLFRLDEEAKQDTTRVMFMTYRIPARITQVASGDGADKAGMAAGDEIIRVGNTATPDLMTFLDALKGHDNQKVTITFTRRNGSRTDTITRAVALSGNSKMGIGLETDPSAFFKAEEKHYGLFESIPRGIELGTDKLTSYAKSMKMVFTKEGARSIGGFGAIGSIFPEKWNWIAFWNVAAFLSVALAFMNILPIPALDGGHVLFLLYEVIFRRKPGDKFLEYAQIAGMSLLILLLVYANGMDIVRLFK